VDVAATESHHFVNQLRQTLRVTPAMEAGVTDHAGSVGEFVALLT